ARAARARPAGPRDASEVDQPPRIKNCPNPSYPRACRRAGLEGEVVLKLLIDTNGNVDTIEVERHEGAETFRRVCVDEVEDWSFHPARHEGRLVKVWVRKRFVFKLGS